MGEVGKFVILESNFRSDPIESFEERREFDEMFNRTYNYIKDALLWTDTITTFLDKITVNDATREHMLSFKKEPVEIDEYMDRLASFPRNLRFVAKKMALYFQNNGISLSSIIKPGFNPIINPIIEVVIIAVLHYFLIETEYEDIFERMSTQLWFGPTKDNGEHFFVFFKLIDQEFNLPGSQITWLDNYHDRKPYYRSILKAAEQLSTMIGLSGFLNTDSSQFDQMPSERRQELINLLQDTSKKVRIYAKIEDGAESPPSKEVMSMLGSLDEPLALRNAKAIEIIRSKIAASRHSRRGGKRRKSSNHTQRRKKNGKRFKRTMKH